MKRVLSIKYVAFSLVAIALFSCGGDEATVGSYRVGGVVTGLMGSSMELIINGGDNETIEADGRYYFDTKINDGKKFTIDFSQYPDGLNCTIHHKFGEIDGSDITDANIDCN